MEKTMVRGTQIIYVPTHAEGDTDHPDVEEGFVTAVRIDAAFCRYWSKYSPGELRTRANSELTPIDCLVIKDTQPQARVNRQLALIDEEQGIIYTTGQNRFVEPETD